MKVIHYLNLALLVLGISFLGCSTDKVHSETKSQAVKDDGVPFSELRLEYFNVEANARARRASGGIYHEVIVSDTIHPDKKLSDFPTKIELNNLLRVSQRVVDTTRLDLLISDLKKLYAHVDIKEYHFNGALNKLNVQYIIKDWYNKGEKKDTPHSFSILLAEDMTIDSILTE